MGPSGGACQAAWTWTGASRSIGNTQVEYKEDATVQGNRHTRRMCATTGRPSPYPFLPRGVRAPLTALSRGNLHGKVLQSLTPPQPAVRLTWQLSSTME